MEVAAVGWGISMAGWLISPYISKLLNKANSHVKVDINIDELVTHLIPRLKFVLEAAEGSKNTKTLGELVSKLKSAFHVTEDIVDEIEYIRHRSEAKQRKKNARQRKRKSPESGPSNQFPPLLKADLEKNVKVIRELIDEARKTLSSQNEGSIPTWGSNLLSGSGRAKHGPNATADNTEKKGARPTGEVTGRDDLRNHIMARFKDGVCPGSSGTCLSAIGIYGIPGSGKTTLAQHIFKAEKASGYFDLVMWIHVSENFRVGTIFMEMIEQACEKNDPCPTYNSIDALTTKLEKLIYNKRILLVLDDVWCSKEVDQKKLPELLPPLLNASKGSKILVTGRLQDAVYELGPEVRIIDNSKIPDLDDKVFLELFMHHAFGHQERYQPLVTVGTRIAQKLKKSPLLAKAVGGVLCKKQDVRRWRSFEDQKIWEKHMGPLLWCYQHLDEQAKRCFAYCSIFPRRRHLYRHELVNLWVAEGFISTTDRGWDMECVSEDCFDELLSVSFLQPAGRDRWGKDCSVIHDLLHDLAEMVAGSDCFKIENALAKAPSDVRHLSIESCSASMIAEDIVKLKNLRTLIIFHGSYSVDEEVLDKMFMELTKLRVLILQNVGEIKDLPVSVKYVKHLRYLGLQNWMICDVFNLPGTIGELYLLQVLEMDFHCTVKFKLPTGLDVTGLANLRHVISNQFPFPNIGRMTSLRTVPILNVEKGQGYELHQLGDLNNLRGKLEIRGLSDVNSKEEALRAKLADKRRVTSLALRWGAAPWVVRRPEVDADVFEGLRPPEGLEYMSIYTFKGSRYPEWMFGREKSKMELQRLELSYCSKLVPAPVPGLFFLGVISLKLHECDWDAMPYNMVHLTELEISNSDREELPDNMDQLTSLKKFTITHCLYFRRIPALPPSLQYFEVKYCGKEFTMSCRDEVHPNYKAIENIRVKHIVGYEYTSVEDSDQEEDCSEHESAADDSQYETDADDSPDESDADDSLYETVADDSPHESDAEED